MYIISFTVAIFVFDYGENGDEEGVGFLHKIYPGIFFGDQKGPMSCSPLPVTGKRKINRGCGDRGGGKGKSIVAVEIEGEGVQETRFYRTWYLLPVPLRCFQGTGSYR